MADAARLQAFLRATVAAQPRDVVAIPPFTAFLHRTDSMPYLNYAIPDHAGPYPRDAIDGLRDAFDERDRIPRLEFIDETAPALAPALAAAGMREELRTPLMTCDEAGLAELAPPQGTSLEDVDVREAVDLQRVAFGQPPLGPGEDVGEGRVVLARVDGEPAAAATWTSVIDGAAEIGGVATAEAFRNRGLASIVTVAASRAAFSAGATMCVLSPGGEAAQRVYARAGFRRAATMLHWSDAPPPE